MATYEVTAPDGRKLRLTGDTPPTDADLDEVFADLPPTKGASDPISESLAFEGQQRALPETQPQGPQPSILCPHGR